MNTYQHESSLKVPGLDLKLTQTQVITIALLHGKG